MQKQLLIILLSLVSTVGFGHETNKAFFEIIQKDSIVEVHCEFPWTIRSALMAYDTALENAKSKKDFENTFTKYITESLILTDNNGHNLALLGFSEVENNGHSHANNYLLTFKGSGITTLKNTIMFNVFDHQENYHTYKSGTRDFSFSTKNGSPTVNLNEEESAISKLWLLLGLVPILFLTLKFTRK